MTFGTASRSKVGAIGASIRSLVRGSKVSLKSRERAAKILRRKRRQIVDALADADEMDRQFEFLGNGNQDAAARGAVELGHDEAGDAGDLAEYLDLRQRVLADGGIEHEQHGVRRAAVELFHHAH